MLAACGHGKAMAVTCHDSTWGNVGLDHVTKASICQISMPMPGEALGGVGMVVGTGLQESQCLRQGPWVSRVGPAAVPITA